MRTARVRQNGEEGVYDVHYGEIEKFVVGAMATLICTGILSTIVLYREVGVQGAKLDAALAAAEHANASIEAHRQIPSHTGTFQNFVTREEYARDNAARNEDIYRRLTPPRQR